MYTEPLYQKIYRDLHDGIINGKYRVGDRLPSEKELADAYDVTVVWIAHFDGYESDELLLSPYTHILQDQYQMGVAAVSMLVRKERGDEVPSRAVIPHIMVAK